MHFLAPSLLLGLLAAALPAIIHRIGRRQARPIRFAAMELLLRAEHEVSARRRLRDALLLVARTGLAMALPLAFARPFAEVRSDLPAVTGRSQSAVVILDDSASMRRRAADGGTPFDAARAKARAVIEHLSADSEVALVLASEGSAAPIAELASDRPRVVAALEAVPSSARRADFAAALRRATQILASSTRADRLIYVATDLQAAGWGDVKPATGPGAPQIVLLDASGGAAWTNRAVVALAAEPAPEEGAQGIAVIAEIANFSPEPARNLGVTLALDGAQVARGFVDVPAAGRARKRFVLTTAGGSAHEAEVAIDKDSFPLDDRRACLVEASRGLRVLLVDGDPRTVRTEDETFFLEAALRAGGSGFSVTNTLPDDLASRDLSGFGAVFMANVNRPTPTVAAALLHYVEAGGGLFISVGDRVDTDAWNQTARALLPQPLGLKRSAAALPGAHAEGETVDLRPAERLAPIDRRHPAAVGLPRPRRRAVVGAVLPVHAAVAGARRARAADRAALRERRAGAGRGRRRPWPRPAAHHDHRSRVDRPADPSGFLAADSGDRPLPGGRPLRRGGDRRRRRTEAGDRPRTRRSPGRGGAARRRIALADAAGTQRRPARAPHGHLRGHRLSRASIAFAPRAATGPSASAPTPLSS